MDYTYIEYEFVYRTYRILEQYDLFVKPQIAPEDRFEVTLLINGLTGLIVYPFEMKKRRQKGTKFPQICKGDEEIISKLTSEWGLTNLDISEYIIENQPIPPEDRTLRKTVAMFRHSMAHSRFHGPKLLKDLQGHQIDKMIFENKFRETNFVVTILVADLRTFAMKLARTVLNEMQDKYPYLKELPRL